tara:strand:+ start:9013 stop:9186 length:174 start_codon:yes stop_codon:yes gene_type:complete
LNGERLLLDFGLGLDVLFDFYLGSCLTSGELSDSRLIRFDFGGPARAALHDLQFFFR